MKPRSTHPAGVALVIVLAFLVLISAIIIGFFSSVSTEYAMSTSVAETLSTRQLADSAVNVVMAQMWDATKGGTTDTERRAWASQPGMIRTYDSKGAPSDFYKLYSSDAMTVKGKDFSIALEVPPVLWKTPNFSEYYVDMNAPVTSAAGDLLFPILDPAADGTASKNRPADQIKVDGFSITAPPGYTAGLDESTVNNRAPMPVKWLYVLKDGTLHAGTNPQVNLVTVDGATTLNPIVGRIAFWTDDEGGKININTASEGTYWDVPRIYSPEDFGQNQAGGGALAMPGFSVAQPIQGEFQRYPGHPATTCLSPVFGKFLPVTSPYPPNPTAADAAKLDPYYKLIPRIGVLAALGGGSGGSQGGTVQVDAGAAPLQGDTERLYASPDELMFTTITSGVNRVPNTSATLAPKLITKSILEKSKFFITANSVAPETTLYNTPRIAMWPISPTRTPYDSLLAFCSTIGGKEYFIARSNPKSGTADMTARNSKLYEYLQALTKTDVPGFGGNFTSKWSAPECDQILTYLVDYIRSTNLQDHSNGASPFTGTYPAIGSGEVVPLRIGNTQGFGRFYGITSASLLFYGSHVDAQGKVDRMGVVFFIAPSTPEQGLACMRSSLRYTVKGLEQLTASGKNLNFKVNGGSNGTNFVDMADLDQFHGRGVGGTESPWTMMKGKPFLAADAGGSTSGKYPFFSSQDVDVSGLTQFALNGNAQDITVEITQRDNPSYVIQTVHLRFPPGVFKVPAAAETPSSPPPPAAMTTAGFAARTGGDYGSMIKGSDTVVSLQVAGSAGAGGGVGNGANVNKGDDPTGGDFRMVGSLINVPADRYRPDNAYSTQGVQWAHCLVQSVGETFPGATYGKLANVTSYNQAGSIPRHPDISSRAPNGVTRDDGRPGDWDTGFGDQKDGAYINKPDEGDTALQDDVGVKRLPYMLGFGKGFASATNGYFSPNRMIPSAMVFGSIPTGVVRMKPWQTLSFCPRPEDPNHPGNVGLKDHLIADLFWMPVVQPYAISQPFATSGKINMNYQLMPFTYINRATGMHAVMRATKFAALAASDCDKYKPLDKSNAAPTAPNRRLSIDMAKTLEAFDNKFLAGDIFRSATQICEMNLVPTGETNSTMANFWGTKFTFTGDNLREKPYVDIYPRLTTKSNTFTVHVRVQSLKKLTTTPANQWVGGKDQVVGEYRGSSIVERYIDVNDPALPDFASLFASDPSSAALNIDKYYRMRVVSTRKFSP